MKTYLLRMSDEEGELLRQNAFDAGLTKREYLLREELGHPLGERPKSPSKLSNEKLSDAISSKEIKPRQLGKNEGVAFLDI